MAQSHGALARHDRSLHCVLHGVSASADVVAAGFGTNSSTSPPAVAANQRVDRVSLVAPGATSHGTDMRQRVVFLQVWPALRGTLDSRP
jgi:hypothetical protein